MGSEGFSVIFDNKHFSVCAYNESDKAWELSKLITLWGWIPRVGNWSLSSHREHPKYSGMRGSSASIASLPPSCSLESRAEWAKCQIAPFLFSPGEIKVRAVWEGKGHQSSFQMKFRNLLLRLNFSLDYLHFPLKLDKVIFLFVSVGMFCRQLV